MQLESLTRYKDNQPFGPGMRLYQRNGVLWEIKQG